MNFNLKIKQESKPKEKLLAYDGRGDKIDLLTRKINEIRTQKELEGRNEAYLSATGSLKIYSLHKLPNYDKAREHLSSLASHGQICSYLEKLLLENGVDKLGIRRELGKIHKIVSDKKIEFTNESYNYQASLENLESAINRKLDKSFESDDQFSKISSFVLNFNEGKIIELKIIRHFLFKGKYLIEYVTKDELVGAYKAHLPINKIGLLKGQDSLLGEIKGAVNSNEKIPEKIKTKILASIEKRTNT